MKYLAPIAILWAVVVLKGRAADPPQKSSQEYVRPFPGVFFPSNATEAHKAVAKEIAEALGNFASPMKTNPTCCVWVELTGWAPNPGTTGYVIINQPGGSIINASDIDQLRAAMARIKKTLRKNGDQIEVPIGLMTNYPVVTGG